MLLLLLVAAGIIDFYVLFKLISDFKLLKIHADDSHEPGDLPSVSICISARNETHAMTQCLERVIACEYPKLEIIVLDDGSRDNTSVLIKSFAHSGVRFVEGKPLPDGWLGKNYAQSMLASEASGKLVFFMDVDTLIDRRSLIRLVEYYLKHRAKMVSVLPIRDDHYSVSTLLTTMRHFWTLMRFGPHHPRATSNAWLIDRQLILNELKTDESLPLSVQMETTIARKLAVKHQYRLVLSNTWLGIRYEKRYSSQVETSIRLLYPQSDKNILQAVWLLLLMAVTLVPYVLVWLHPTVGIIVVLQYVVTLYYLAHVWVRYRFIGALLLPVTLAQEMWLLILSIYHYKKGTVNWKGRPVQKQTH